MVVTWCWNGCCHMDWKKNIKSHLALTEAKKHRSQKTMKEIERIVSNPRKEAVTTNSQWFTWWFSFEAVFLNIRKLLVLYLLLPQSEAVVERSFLYMKMIMTDKKTNLVSESLEALKRLSQKQIFLCWRSKLYYWNLAVLL